MGFGEGLESVVLAGVGFEDEIFEMFFGGFFDEFFDEI